MERNIRKSLLFIGLTFLISYSLAFAYFALGGKWNTPAAMVVAVIYMFIPMTVAIFVQKLVYKEAVREPLGVFWRFNRWFLVAWLLPPIIAFLTLGVSFLLPGVEYSPDMTEFFARYEGVLGEQQLEQMKDQAAALPIHIIWLALAQGLIVGPTINAVAGFGEELGWRGFLQRELRYMGFWRSSALIGLIWGLWHAPIILQGHNYPQHPVAGVAMMTLFCLLLGPIFSYIRLRAGSVIAAAIGHGSLNATGALGILVLRGGNDLTVGITGLAGLIVLAIIDLGIYLFSSVRGSSWGGL